MHPNTVSAPTLDSQLCFALYAASRQVTAIYRTLLDDLDLTYPQFLVMLALWEEDGIAISTLAERTTLGNSTLTPLLRLLEKKGLITRSMVSEDERQKLIGLTRSGKNMEKLAGPITDKAFCSTGLSKNEAKEMIRLTKLLMQGTAP